MTSASQCLTNSPFATREPYSASPAIRPSDWLSFPIGSGSPELSAELEAYRRRGGLQSVPCGGFD